MKKIVGAALLILGVHSLGAAYALEDPDFAPLYDPLDEQQFFQLLGITGLEGEQHEDRLAKCDEIPDDNFSALAQKEPFTSASNSAVSVLPAIVPSENVTERLSSVVFRENPTGAFARKPRKPLQAKSKTVAYEYKTTDPEVVACLNLFHGQHIKESVTETLKTSLFSEEFQINILVNTTQKEVNETLKKLNKKSCFCVCPLCGRRSIMTGLGPHLGAIHSFIEFTCPYEEQEEECAFKTRYRNSLVTHLKAVHRND